MKRVDFASVVLGYLVLVLVLGGASAAALGTNLLLQLLGAGLIAACLWRRDPLGALPKTGLRGFALALVVLALVQFVPLPFAAWSALPGRAETAAALGLLGAAQGWMTISFSPWASLAALAWWIPAFALFLATLRSDSPGAGAIVRTVVAVAVVSVAIGALQRGGGALYFYRITNYGYAPGFFANTNHQASFLLGALALWGAHHVARRSETARTGANQTATIGFYGIALVLVVGILMTNSLAGTGLLLPVGLCVVLLARPQTGLSPPVLLGGLTLLGLAAVGLALFGTVQDNFTDTAGGADNNRLAFLVTGWAALRELAPFGSGLGTFVDVYHWFERPATINTTYVNHAHNDLLELLIETGVFGLAALGLFLAWWSRRVRAAWSAVRRNPYAQGATILTGAVLVHSLVDYPLRTAAVSGLFAVAVALMIRPHRPATRGPARRSVAGQEPKVVI